MPRHFNRETIAHTVFGGGLGALIGVGIDASILTCTNFSNDNPVAAWICFSLIFLATTCGGTGAGYLASNDTHRVRTIHVLPANP
jgi:hypothetical protein